MKRDWMIFDWAGNKPFGEQRFDTFEDAWEHVFSHLAEIGDYDPESPGEYYVERICAWEI